MIINVGQENLRVDKSVGNAEHLHRGHEMEVHDAFAEAGQIEEQGYPQEGGAGNSEELKEDRPPA